MRILMLTSRIPYPPYRGDRIRTWNALLSFSKQHDVDLFTFVEDAECGDELSMLRDHAKVVPVVLSKRASYVNMLARALSPMPFQASYYASREMASALERALDATDYDVVYAHLFRMAPFLMSRGAVRRARPRQRFVMDMADAISSEIRVSLSHRSFVMRPPLAWEAAKIARYEAQVARAFDETWIVSEADRDDVLRLAPGASLRVMPNGLDRSLLSLESGADTVTGRCSTVLFVGNLSIPHNVDAVVYLAREIMPMVVRVKPRVRLRVVGHSVAPRVAALDELAWVDVVGYVESLQDVYRGGDVFAAPLRYAAGVQNKVVEAMASGIPCVVTGIVNRGLDAAPDREIIVRDDPEGFAREVVGLLGDRERSLRIGEAGRRLVAARYDWQSLCSRLEELVQAD